ncbi:hypothetical protein [Parabacteroides sp. 20_3]|uniref:hypothetical protein n=1 Tax=Parabacteroides sp. 20_3 TaxID=469591 RepID=UPI0011C0E831|nr:hypothetical protein [Parabacteroides sp. 20_3]
MDLPGLHHQAVGLADPVYESDGLAKYLGNDPYDRSHPSRGLRNDPHDRNGPFRGLGSDFDARRRYSIDKSMIIKGIILYL